MGPEASSFLQKSPVRMAAIVDRVRITGEVGNVGRPFTYLAVKIGLRPAVFSSSWKIKLSSVPRMREAGMAR